jgi:hypothetical protein
VSQFMPKSTQRRPSLGTAYLASSSPFGLASPRLARVGRAEALWRSARKKITATTVRISGLFVVVLVNEFLSRGGDGG